MDIVTLGAALNGSAIKHAANTSIYIQETEPIAPSNGDYWISSTNGVKTYIFGSNIYDKDNPDTYSAYLSDGDYWILNDSSISILLPVTPNTQYKFSVSGSDIFRLSSTDSDSPEPAIGTTFSTTRITRTTGITTHTFTTGATDKYIIFQGTFATSATWLQTIECCILGWI